MMRTLRVLYHQVGFDLLIFRRNPASTFFTIVFPLIFLFVFVGVFGNQELTNGTPVANVYVAGLLALQIVSATTMNLAITTTMRREGGMLKRVRGTPLAPWVFLMAQAVGAFVIALAAAILMNLAGWLVFGVNVVPETLVSLGITILIGSASFSMLGLALSIIIPSQNAAPAIANAILLPLYFISGVFIPDEQIPGWISDLAGFFPIKHLASALFESYDPFASGMPWPATEWLVIATWGLFAAALVLRFFRWNPRS